MTDLHLHTHFSPDSEERAENYILAAHEKGANILGFSEHYDYDVILDGGRNWDLPDMQAHLKELSELQTRYPRIKILKGVELGYAEGVEERYKELFSAYELDYAILSVHTLKQRGDCYFPAFFHGLTKQQAYGAYFDAVLKSVRSKIDYQIIGHLGYVARHAPYSEKRIVYREFSDIIDEILREIIARGKSLEVNTKSNGTGELTVPGKEIILRYLDLGGSRLTFGSDAHTADKFLANAEAVKAFLLSCGVTQICHYEARKLKKENLY